MCVCVNICNNGSGSWVFKKFKNFMQVDIDEVYTCTKFGGHDFFGFGDIAIFQIWPNFPFGPWAIIVHGGQKIESAQKICASRGWCEMHANQFWWVWLL